MEPVKTYKSAVGVRGDCLYCPLPLYVDSYWNCLADCHHCYMRRLNRTWGMDLRPADPDQVRHTLEAGMKNQKPKSSLAWALYHKKTIRLGNKTDPYQDVELEHRVSQRIQRILIDLDWSYIVQTRFLDNLLFDQRLLKEAHDKGLLTIMPIITPGAESDWEVLERKRTTPISRRLHLIEKWISKGVNLGVQGEPFIPGYHTVEQFRDILQRLKDVGVKSYNTYNLHLNDHVAKRLAGIGLKIDRIWRMNQDKKWKPILKQLCQVADEMDIVLGCPDFVNVPKNWVEKSNTCCGIQVPNPSRYNTHYWRKDLQTGKSEEDIAADTWEGIGDKEQGAAIIGGEDGDFYSIKGFSNKKKEPVNKLT